jgi:hypothetical protein
MQLHRVDDRQPRPGDRVDLVGSAGPCHLGWTGGSTRRSRVQAVRPWDGVKPVLGWAVVGAMRRRIAG